MLLESMDSFSLPGLLSTSYASFTAAIFASLPPLSGWAVIAALRLCVCVSTFGNRKTLWYSQGLLDSLGIGVSGNV